MESIAIPTSFFNKTFMISIHSRMPYAWIQQCKEWHDECDDNRRHKFRFCVHNFPNARESINFHPFHAQSIFPFRNDCITNVLVLLSKRLAVSAEVWIHLGAKYLHALEFVTNAKNIGNYLRNATLAVNMIYMFDWFTKTAQCTLPFFLSVITAADGEVLQFRPINQILMHIIPIAKRMWSRV